MTTFSKVALAVALAFIITATPARLEDEPFELNDTIVVTAQRTPVTYSELSRTVTVLGPEDIAAAPTHSVIDLLSYVPGIEVRRMGNNGVRADLAIRGGSFEQALVLVDGVKVTDPQTGHHNLDLPFDLAEVERIEIVRGSGSKLYGPNAMSGVINIITKRARGTSLHLESVSGENSLAEHALAATVNTGPIGHRVSASRRTCAGYINNTEFDQTSLAYRAGWDSGLGPVNMSARYADRKFGAFRLYTDDFPDQWEATTTSMVAADAQLRVGRALLSPRAYYRHHEDDFVLFRDNPNRYRNRHTTNSYGVELQATLPSPLGETVIGSDIGADEIASASLGDHYRSRIGFFGEQRIRFVERFSLVPGLSVYRHRSYGWQAWPGIDLGYNFSDHSRIYLTFNRAYRVPNHTELFYQDPGNRGDSLLQPEDATSIELGGRHAIDGVALAGSIFVQRGTDQIDWARHPDSATWQVQNVARVTTSGLELQLGADAVFTSQPLALRNGKVQYTYLDSHRSGDQQVYKYLLEHVRHQIVIDLNLHWFERVNNRWLVRYSRRMTGTEYTVVDTKFSTPHRHGSVFLEITNLLDQAYSEIRTIPMPGRWLKIGVAVNLRHK